MSKNKANPLAVLIGYGDSDEGSDDESTNNCKHPARTESKPLNADTVRAAPIQNCPWSACYDESTGFTYYWNQVTNAVTWEAPPEYLLALKLAQSRMAADATTRTSEVSTEEWQLYQQVLAEKQKQTKSSIKEAVKPSTTKHIVASKLKGIEKNSSVKRKPSSDDEDVKIQLITSYSNSDSESNDEQESPKKPVVKSPPSKVNPPPTNVKPVEKPRNPHKKLKTKPATVEYGPSLPPNQNYTVPIGPELPSNLIVNDEVKSPKSNGDVAVEKPVEKQDEPEDPEEIALLKRLKDKAKILEKLGGELPTDVQNIIKSETNSTTNSRGVSPLKDENAIEETCNDNKSSLDIDDLLAEIEKKELPKVKKSKLDVFNDGDSVKSSQSSAVNSPKDSPIREVKQLFPSSNAIGEEPVKCLFPSAVNMAECNVEENKEIKSETPPHPLPSEEVDKKAPNLYIMDVNERIENTNRKKLRISNSVLPERKKETKVDFSYTTKYSQHIEGFSSERIGLGFREDNESESPKSGTINYGKGLMFTKGETLNEDKKDEDLEDLTDLLDAKLKFLNQLQPCVVAPVQEMMIQMQTLRGAARAGALSTCYWRAWAGAAARALHDHEAGAAPPGWRCCFNRSEGRYQYRREADGLIQFEYPAATSTDMEICTTPPPPPDVQPKEQPPLPPTPPPPPALERPLTPPPPAWSEPPPPPAWSDPPLPGCDPPPPGCDPPPPGCDPPPPGCDPPPPGCDTPPPPLPPMRPKVTHPPKEIKDELMSFYNDIAELEQQAPPPPPVAPPVGYSAPHVGPPFTATPAGYIAAGPPAEYSAPRTVLPAEYSAAPQPRSLTPEPDLKEVKKKKSKVKISTSLGRKQKTVSTLVAKWQQVAEEINHDE